MKKLIYFAFLLLSAVFWFRSDASAIDLDPNFHPRVQMASPLGRAVSQIVPLSNGKMLVLGGFNYYNGQPVGELLRLNPDASLDTTFNNHVLSDGNYIESILVQADGKLLLVGGGNFADGSSFWDTIVRLTADGDVDRSFVYVELPSSYFGRVARLDANGRLVIYGGYTIRRFREDGLEDPSFHGPNIISFAEQMNTDGDKVVYVADEGSLGCVAHRLNEDGSPDETFTPSSATVNGGRIIDLQVQPDGRILVQNNTALVRLSPNGGFDPSFSNVEPQGSFFTKFLLNGDGKIVVAYYNPYGVLIEKLLQNGSMDPTFSQSQLPANTFRGFALRADNSILVGTSSGDAQASVLTKLFADGSVDPGFNAGNRGFENLPPSRIRTINIGQAGKVLFGGTFDLVDENQRTDVAVLNDDGSIDPLQIDTTGAGDRFTQIRDVYHAIYQPDGKVILSGGFNYRLNGLSKDNVVRLNADGAIDSTFQLGVPISDTAFAIPGSGTNPIFETAAGKLLVGNTRLGTNDPTGVPIRLNADGSKDTSFDSALFQGQKVVTYAIAKASDGKIVIVGRTDANDSQSTPHGFVARLNTDGSADESFINYDQVNCKIYAVALLGDGKMLIVRRTDTESTLLRLNSDGSVDSSFNSGTSDRKINTVVELPNGQILLGGLFSRFAGESRQNLALLNANGTLEENPGNFNDEILTITLDEQGRVLLGGSFTSIGNASVPYIARMTNGVSQITRTMFDFDGDGKADTSVFRPASGNWYLNRSTAGFTGVSFGNPTDKIAPADFDGDGKTDVAVYRPENGTWYWLNSSNGAFNGAQFGTSEDVPVPADYDGDGKADVSVFRPSSGTWYRLNSSNGSFFAAQFGISEDKPTVGDFDGDGRADIAVWRPSNGAWYRLNSSNGQFVAVGFGLSDDLITPADFDGDSKTDIAVYRPSTGTWYWLGSSNGGFNAAQFGVAEDIPSAADYDGDGRADISVFRPSNGTWYRLNSSNGGFVAEQFGTNGDRPTPAAFRY